MQRKLYVSTGTMVGRKNGFDYKRALSEIEKLYKNGLCDGMELMMLVHYYDKFDDVTSAVSSCGVKAETIHCEKDVGTLISDAGKLYSEGEREKAAETVKEAVRLFDYNCEFAEKLSISRMVLHLWGGFNSDNHIEYNISVLPQLQDIAVRHGVRLLIENIPSQKSDPRTNWRLLLPSLGNSAFIFDTRFGCLHAQSRDILTDKEITKHIEHMHISDFGGGYREFSALRPILHPGEGNVDFSEIKELINGFGYSGTITLESPVIGEDDLDIPKICKTLSFIKDNLCNY